MATQTESGWDQVLVDITDYVFHYKVESANAWRTSRTALLDALACAIETIHTSAECRRMLGPIVPGTVTPDGFKLPGTSYQLDPVKGAFDLGTAIRYLDHNDSLGGADWGHPSGRLTLPERIPYQLTLSLFRQSWSAVVGDGLAMSFCPKRAPHSFWAASVDQNTARSNDQSI